MRPRRQTTSPYRQRAALRDLQAAASTPAPRLAGPLSVHHIATGGDLLGLDHVGLSVADPEAMTAFLCDHVGMHLIGRTGDFAVVGAGDGAPLWLTYAAGPRAPGALGRLILRVADVERAIATLPAGTPVEGDRLEEAKFVGPEGLGLGFTMVAGGGIDYDLDHVLLRCSDPEQARAALAGAGFVPRGQALHVADKYLTVAGSPNPTQRPLLDHIAVRVDSIDGVAANSLERGLEIVECEMDDTVAVVLSGPEQIRLHFMLQTSRG